MAKCRDCHKSVTNLFKVIKYIKSFNLIIDEGKKYFQEKDYENAIIKFQDVLTKDPKNIEIKGLLDLCLQNQNLKKTHNTIEDFIRYFMLQN